MSPGRHLRGGPGPGTGSGTLTRRTLLLGVPATVLGSAAHTAVPAAATGAEEVALALRRGGAVIALRHARAPGTFDPPGMRLDDCRTQRNLSDDGREQARGIGRWFAARGLQPARVRSSPWCRCVDTATLAFGRAEPWAALASPVGQPEQASRESIEALRAALVAARNTAPGRFEAWVTHMFVLSALCGESTDSGEGLVLTAATDGSPRVLARLRV